MAVRLTNLSFNLKQNIVVDDEPVEVEAKTYGYSYPTCGKCKTSLHSVGYNGVVLSRDKWGAEIINLCHGCLPTYNDKLSYATFLKLSRKVKDKRINIEWRE